MQSLYLFCLVFVLGSTWKYPYEATEWGEFAPICENGTSQSPIDLPAHGGQTQNKLGLVVPTGGYNLTASRDHSLKWVLHPATPTTLTFNEVEYSLAQIHCHTGSEHTVDGVQLPGECHFVFISAESAYAVVGVFLEDHAAVPHPALSQLLDHLPVNDD